MIFQEGNFRGDCGVGRVQEELDEGSDLRNLPVFAQILLVFGLAPVV
jgi:hypothetical protein